MKMIGLALASASLFAAPIAQGATTTDVQRPGDGLHSNVFDGGVLRRGDFGEGFRRNSFRQEGFGRDRSRNDGPFVPGAGERSDLWLYGGPVFQRLPDHDYGYGPLYPADDSHPPHAGSADWSGPPPWQYQLRPPGDQAASRRSCGGSAWDPDHFSYKWAIC